MYGYLYLRPPLAAARLRDAASFIANRNLISLINCAGTAAVR